MRRLWAWLTGRRRLSGWSLASIEDSPPFVKLTHDVCGRNYYVADLDEVHVLSRSHACPPRSERDQIRQMFGPGTHILSTRMADGVVPTCGRLVAGQAQPPGALPRNR
jgi:hypothetical protein